ncbi:MAG: hypothetical protein PHF84_10175 [bacterium]|nr:hypothetical protein [bacterium]
MFKSFLVLSFIIILILVLILAGASLYIRKVFTQEKLSAMAEKYSRQYLARKIIFKEFKFDIFQGIVFKDISVGKNPDLDGSAEFTAGKLSLRYDFRQLLKFKIFFNRISLEKLSLDLEAATLNREIGFYRGKFFSTNQNRTNVKQPASEKKLDIRIIEISDSRIRYRGQELYIRDFSFQKDKIMKIKNEFIILYRSHDISIQGTAFLYKKSISVNQEAEIPDMKLSLDLRSRSSNSRHFTSILQVNHRNSAYSLETRHSLEKQELLFLDTVIRDFRNNTFFIPRAGINLKDMNTSIDLNFDLKQFDNGYLEQYHPLAQPLFSADLKARLNATGNLKDIRSFLVSGEIRVSRLSLQTGTNRFDFRNTALLLKKNRLTAENGTVVFRDNIYRFGLSHDDIRDGKKDVTISLSAEKVDYPLSFIPVLYKFKSAVTWNPVRKVIDIRRYEAGLFKGTVSGIGQVGYSGPVKVLIDLQAVGFDMEEVRAAFRNQMPVTGTMNGKASLNLSVIDKKAVFSQLSGSVSSRVNYNEFRNISVKGSFGLEKNILYLRNGICEYNRNTFPFSGSIQLDARTLQLSSSGKAGLDTFLDRTGRGMLDYDLNLNQDLNAGNGMDLKISFSTPEVYYDFYPLRNVSGTLTVHTNALRSDVTVADFYTGQVKASVKGDIKERFFSLTSSGERINIKDLSRNYLTGTITGSMKYSLALKTAGTNFSADLQLNLSKGEVADTEYQKHVSGILGLVEINDVLYKEIIADLKIDNSFININKLDVNCPDQAQINNVKGYYQYRTKKRNLSMDVRVHEELINKIPHVAYPLIKQKDGWYRMTIPLIDP